MKAKDHPAYRPEFPEAFNWGILESHTLAHLAIKLARAINTELELEPAQRCLTPGLREALREVAKLADI